MGVGGSIPASDPDEVWVLLMRAARVGDLALLQSIVGRYRHDHAGQQLLRRTDGRGNTALHVAVLHRNFRIARILFSADEGCAALHNQEGLTPPLLACTLPHGAKYLRFFLTAAPAVAQQCTLGDCPRNMLHLLLARRSFAAFRAALQSWPEAHFAELSRPLIAPPSPTPLGMAIRMDLPGFVQELLLKPRPAGCDPITPSSLLLHAAVRSRALHCLALLLLLVPASLSEADARSRTALHAAAAARLWPGLALLLPAASPALLLAQDAAGDTFLHLLALPPEEELGEEDAEREGGAAAAAAELRTSAERRRDAEERDEGDEDRLRDADGGVVATGDSTTEGTSSSSASEDDDVEDAVSHLHPEAIPALELDTLAAAVETRISAAECLRRIPADSLPALLNAVNAAGLKVRDAPHLSPELAAFLQESSGAAAPSGSSS